jgi:hypothetical protein
LVIIIRIKEKAIPSHPNPIKSNPTQKTSASLAYPSFSLWVLCCVKTSHRVEVIMVLVWLLVVVVVVVVAGRGRSVGLVVITVIHLLRRKEKSGHQTGLVDLDGRTCFQLSLSLGLVLVLRVHALSPSHCQGGVVGGGVEERKEGGKEERLVVMSSDLLPSFPSSSLPSN